MSCSSCGCNICTCDHECDPSNEPLASALNNFITAFFGSVTKTCVNDEVVWALPCDLDAGIAGFPRLANEGVACYLLRYAEAVTNGPAGGTLGGTYPNPTIATGGSGNFTPGSVIFAGATGGLAEDNPNFFWDDTNNRLGIGITAPVSQLHLRLDDQSRIIIESNTSVAATNPSELYFYRSRGTSAAKIIVNASDQLMRETFQGYDGASFRSAAEFRCFVDPDGVPAAGSMPGILQFLTSPTGTVTPEIRMTIKATGFVSIGANTSPNSILQVSGAIATPISTKIAAYPVVATDSVILGDATAGAFAVTLPTPVGIAGRLYTVKKIDASGNAVTVATAAGTIDGAATAVIAVQYAALSFVSDGANWFIV